MKLRSKQFSRRPAWTADIIVGLQAGEELVIEYDGAYWHRAKEDVDRAKSLDLLAGGYRLVRLREHPLPPLDVKDSKYAELVVYSTASVPEEVMQRIRTLRLAAVSRDVCEVTCADTSPSWDG